MVKITAVIPIRSGSQRVKDKNPRPFADTTLMENKMDKLPKLMQQALNYLHKFWKQVFAYRNDGEYSIDNLAAERAIRPQTIQRKGSLFFGSVQGALRSAMYNTFIQTCKQVGVSFRQYFKALLKAVKSCRTDYENLLPMTICLD